MPIGLGRGGPPEPDPRSEEWWETTVYPALRWLRDHAREQPLEAASMSSVPVVSDVADVAMAGRDIGRFATEPSRDTAIDAALSTAGAALPFVGAGMLKAGRQVALPKNGAFSTHEQVPYAKGGHLSELVSAPAETRSAFSADRRSRWRGEGDGDVLLETLGFDTRPMNEGSGLYTPPGRSELEVNPLEIGQARVRPRRGPAKDAVPEGTIGDLNAASATRAYVDVQGASPWNMPIFDRKPEEMNSLFIPMPRGLNPDEARELAATLKEYGLENTADTGQGITVFGFDAPRSAMDEKRAQGLDKAIRGVLREAGAPRPAYVESRYPGFEEAWEAGENSGAATRELRKWLTPEHIRRLDASPEIAQRVRDRLERDEEWARAQGWDTREDIRRAREIIEKEGFSGLFAALDRGALLPAAAAVILPALDDVLPSDQGQGGT